VDSMIPFNRATLTSLEYEYLSRAINLGHVSGVGPFTKIAEAKLSELHGKGTSLLTTSCTHALELSARLLNLRDGDEVIVPSFTFVSTAAAFMLFGAKPVFADVSNETLNLSVESVQPLINERTKAICLVHYAGVGASPDLFRDLANEHRIALIEDNAHGLGGRWNGEPLGTFGDLSASSFHETKNITCGEGGALQINDENLRERAEILREKGTNRSRFFRGEVDKYTWVDIGSSWVLSDLLAAILVAQLERRDQIQQRRKAIWETYFYELQEWADSADVRLPVVPTGADHTAHMFYLRFPDLKARALFIDHMKIRGIGAVFHYQPLHLSDVGRSLGGFVGQCPVSETASEDLVRLPLFYGLEDNDVSRVVAAVKSFRLRRNL
jgi:dTDP-4-amino-4,6-dideoxygalactose transaminase